MLFVIQIQRRTLSSYSSWELHYLHNYSFLSKLQLTREKTSVYLLALKSNSTLLLPKERERKKTWAKGTGKRGHIVARDVSWAAQTGKHLLRTQNVSEQNQKHFLCPGHKICVRNKCCARGQTGKLLKWQQCVRSNVSSFARALTITVNLLNYSACKLSFSTPLLLVLKCRWRVETEAPYVQFKRHWTHRGLDHNRFVTVSISGCLYVVEHMVVLINCIAVNPITTSGIISLLSVNVYTETIILSAWLGSEKC